MGIIYYERAEYKAKLSSENIFHIEISQMN